MSKNLSELNLDSQSIEGVPSINFPSTIKNLRLSQDYESLTDVKQIVTEVSIGKPNRQTFFRVHPEWKAVYPILELKAAIKSEFYIVGPAAAAEIEDEVHSRLLVPLVTRDGRLYIWPLRVGNGEQQLDQAAVSSLSAMQVAKEQWIKLVWRGHSFMTFAAKKDLPSPEWPEIGFDEMLEIAFKGRVIESPDHAVVKSLLGEV